MEQNHFWEFYQEHKGQIWGGLLGLIIAVIILQYGFFAFLLVAFCVGLGVFLGSSEGNRRRAATLFQKIFEKREN